MEKFQEAREKAKRNLKIADHMLFMTYPLVKDNKLLLAILENIFLALTNAMGALLYYERLFKRVPPFHDNFESKMNLFREKCTARYKLSRDYLLLMREVKELVMEHKRSPMEFARKNSLVICSESYQLRTVSLDQIKKYLGKTKDFVREVELIVSQNDGMFK
jgi:hypothetical protein